MKHSQLLLKCLAILACIDFLLLDTSTFAGVKRSYSESQNLADMPIEIKGEIAKRLKIEEVSSLRRVSKAFHSKYSDYSTPWEDLYIDSLDFRRNEFIKDNLDGNCKKIKIDLAHREIGVDDFKIILEIVEKCAYSLLHLDIAIQTHLFSTSSLNLLLAKLGQLSHLQHLNLQLELSNIDLPLTDLEASLKNLRKLKSLHLSLKKVDNIKHFASLATEIRNLKHLNFFSLEFKPQDISENEVSSILLALSQLPSLKKLNCNLLDISISNLQNIAENLKPLLPQLESLQLALELPPETQGMEEFFERLSLAKNLKDLTLYVGFIFHDDFERDFSVAEFNALTTSIKSLPSLNTLSLELRSSLPNDEDYYCLEKLAHALTGLKQLVSLSLDIEECFYSPMNAQEVQAFTLALHELPRLKSLSLNFCEVDFETNDNFLNFILGLRNLHHLEAFKLILGLNSLESLDSEMEFSHSLNTLATLLIGLPQLKSLELHLNGFKKELVDPAWKNFANALKDMPYLENLELTFKDMPLSDLSYQELGKAFSHLSKLKSLSINHFFFKKRAFDPISKGLILVLASLEKMPGLTNLSIFLNGNLMANRDHLQVLRQALTKLPNLKDLSLNFPLISNDHKAFKEFAVTLIEKQSFLKSLSLRFSPDSNTQWEKMVLNQEEIMKNLLRALIHIKDKGYLTYYNIHFGSLLFDSFDEDISKNIRTFIGYTAYLAHPYCWSEE